MRRKRERKGRERSREDCGRGKKGKRRSTRGKIENTVVEALVRVLPQLFPRRAEETSQRVRDSLLVCEVHVTNRESEREERERKRQMRKSNLHVLNAVACNLPEDDNLRIHWAHLQNVVRYIAHLYCLAWRRGAPFRLQQSDELRLLACARRRTAS